MEIAVYMFNAGKMEQPRAAIPELESIVRWRIRILDRVERLGEVSIADVLSDLVLGSLVCLTT